MSEYDQKQRDIYAELRAQHAEMMEFQRITLSGYDPGNYMKSQHEIDIVKFVASPDSYVNFENNRLYVKSITHEKVGYKSFDLNGDVAIDGGDIALGTNTTLPNNLKVAGNLVTNIKDLPDNLTVGGGLFATNIDKLPKGLVVGHTLTVDDTKVKNIPDDTKLRHGIENRSGYEANIPGAFLNKGPDGNKLDFEFKDGQNGVQHDIMFPQSRKTIEAIKELSELALKASNVPIKPEYDPEKTWQQQEEASKPFHEQMEKIKALHKNIYEIVSEHSPNVSGGSEIMRSIEKQIAENPALPHFIKMREEAALEVNQTNAPTKPTEQHVEEERSMTM